MERSVESLLKSPGFRRSFFILCFLATISLMGQETEEQNQDTIPSGIALGHLILENPSSIIAKYTYDPKTDRYIYTESIGDFDLTPPTILTPVQYLELVRKEQMKAYFKQKIDAFTGKKEGSQEAQKNLLPSFYVNSSFFETIFGGSTVEVVPQGSVAMDLGILWSKNDNPALSPRNQTNISFDFDQRISLSLLGKVGERLQVTANYDTEATFDFQNLVKLEYTATEDDILQEVDVGNVNLPLNSALIAGAQSLFGVKTRLQFGKTNVTAVFSEQRSQNNTVVAQGGGVLNEFNLTALDYDEDRHFFLAQYFRDNYDRALQDYPFIRSQVQITRLEVWVTNRSQQTANVRNIVAFQDLGETQEDKTRIGINNGAPAGFFDPSAIAKGLPQNAANAYDPNQIGSGAPFALGSEIRDIATVEDAFNIPGYQPLQGLDFGILENAQKLEQGRDYEFHPQLGYISLNQNLSNDEVLGVAFQYTINGEVFQVGEFANGGIDATTISEDDNLIENNTLVVKLLKSNITNVEDPIWDLMMKNIYATGAFQLSPEDFKLNILYANPTPRNYLTPVEPFPASAASQGKPLEERILLEVLNFDRLNIYNDLQPGGDGFFDYLPGITVDTQSGRIIFTKVEPFGEFLFDLLGGGVYDVENDQGYNLNQQKYVFRNLYAKTKAASLQDAEKNRFQIRGRYTAQSSGGISIGAFNVPQGSVRVTAGGRQLQEGVDFTVNYQAGTVQIIDPALLASDTPIDISVENNAIFAQQNRRFTGLNVEHQFNEKLVLGGTLLNLNERPLTQKANFGAEPVNNTIFGLNGNFSSEAPLLTRLANKLPNIDTEVPSNLSLRGEAAFLLPNSPKSADFQGETTAYLDDFEGAQALIDIRAPLNWILASPPVEFLEGRTDISVGFERAKMAWYSIDPIFYTSQRPSSLSDDDISLNTTRRVAINEIFAETDLVQGQTQVQTTLDVAYYPEQKGPYNANPNFEAEAPGDKWAGIMRSLNSTNFEQTNVEFVQFWVLDPYVDGQTPAANAGELVLNLGNISEDILRDGRKQYENGLPGGTNNEAPRPTIWGQVPATQSLVYAFDADPTNRTLQDIGLDGLDDLDEQSIYNGPIDDPALDNFQFYLDREGDILERYLDFNNTQGNSPVEVSDTNRGSTTLPDVEDVDRDLTMNTVNSYFEYRIPIQPGVTTADRYVTDIREGLTSTLPNGTQINRRWIQYKIPLNDFTDAIGGITDFRSISTMRMYLTGFSDDIVLRFATLDLVQGDWRTFTRSLQPDVDNDPSDDGTTFDVTAVNIEENFDRQPIPYVLPPGVVREQLNNNNNIIRQNEQSLSLRVENLEPQDARAVFKNVNIDLRQYQRIKMFIHAEKIDDNDFADSDTPLVGFLRIGTDFSENFYQVELPLQFTPFTAISAEEIWPEVNEIDVALSDLAKVKSEDIRIKSQNSTNPNQLRFYEIIDGKVEEVNESAPRTLGRARIGIRGIPSLGSLRGIMLGVKNSDDFPARGELWFNELRVAGLDNQGGWAAIAALDANIADFAQVTATGSRSTSGFGALDQKPNERAREDAISYDIVTNINAGQLLPKKWNLQVPFSYGISETLITPEFDPVFDDLKLEDRIDAADNSEEAETIRQQAEDYTKRTSINLIGVKKNRSEAAEAHFFDIENFTFNYAYNETEHRDFEVAERRDQNVTAGFVYNHNFKPVSFAPFAKKDSLFTGKSWQWLKALNINLLPTSVSVNANYSRSFNQQRFRDVLEPGVDALDLPLLQQRNYLFNWQYALNYSLTRSLRLNVITSRNNIIRNYFITEGDPNSGINPDLDLWDGFLDTGEPNRHAQQIQLNYELPFNKLPLLNFVNAQYTYTSNFQWQRGGDALNEVAGEDINTLQNGNTHNLNANLSMQRFYDAVGLKKRNGRSTANPVARRSSKVEEAATTPEKKTPQKTSKAFNTLVDVVTAVKRVNINYSENNTKVLPGYTQSIGFIGTLQPGFGFVLGSQADIRFDAARRGLLTTFSEFNSPYVQNNTEQWNLAANVQPTPDLTIDLIANRQFTTSYEENFKVISENGQLEYQKLLGNTFGNFTISTSMIKTVFSKSDAFTSETFEQFKANRIIIANRLAGTSNEDEFPEGYGKTQQDVLLPAFFAAYTGQDANSVSLSAFRNIPIPSWNIKYTGLMKNRWFKKRFRRFSLNHGYRAAYSVNAFQTNLERQNTAVDPKTGDVLPENIISNVVLTDQFNPLIRVDFEMANSLSVVAEVRTDRTLSLSFDNNLLTEINGKEYTLGLGYRFKDVKFVTRIGGKKTRLKGDLNLKADVSLRDTSTIIRNLDIDNNQIVSGQELLSIKFTADYALNKNINALFFYDHNFSQFAVSTAFPQTTLNTGFTLRYTFGN